MLRGFVCFPLQFNVALFGLVFVHPVSGDSRGSGVSCFIDSFFRFRFSCSVITLGFGFYVFIYCRVVHIVITMLIFVINFPEKLRRKDLEVTRALEE